jgi:hypothetical protein
MISNRVILEAAILGFEQQKRDIDATISELRAQLDGSTIPQEAAKRPASASAPPAKRKHHFSAAGKAAMKEAQRKRWAAFHAVQQTEKPKPAAKKTALTKAAPKRKLSAAAKAKLVANLKKARAAKAAKKISSGAVPV